VVGVEADGGNEGIEEHGVGESLAKVFPEGLGGKVQGFTNSD
jgi:hypothetical protein